MPQSKLPFILLTVAAAFFTLTAVAQFVMGNVTLGSVFVAVAAVNVIGAILLRQARTGK